jgi:hypothetical protein
MRPPGAPNPSKSGAAKPLIDKRRTAASALQSPGGFSMLRAPFQPKGRRGLTASRGCDVDSLPHRTAFNPGGFNP